MLVIYLARGLFKLWRRGIPWERGTPSPMSRVPPVWLVLIGIFSVQFGAGIAKMLFGTVAPTAMVWLRLVTSSLIFCLLARPRLGGHSRQDWWTVIAFGVSLGLMNWSIYQSFAQIPIGIAVTLEFVGPLCLAVSGSRRTADLIWVALARPGWPCSASSQVA